MRYLVATTSVLFLLCACGQKGPLILPEEAIAPKQIPEKIEEQTEISTDLENKKKTETAK